ncbi:hypothetical protein [uncultured Chryseobacterium sp.]|uniref:hypothetical protein n=1 Tax=uncultured Chryseobacterium sp. TaxID=259322 RepID=UPI0025DD9B6F|nr:hypothetical protein [uncultured Chryseobacterium sp.]
MNNKENIFTFNSKSWIGNLGKKSSKVQQPKCKICNKELKEEIKYSKVEVEIERYNGEDMLSASNILIVSENLYEALVNAGINGFAPIKVSKVKQKYSDIDMTTIPTLVYLAILAPPVRNIPIASDFIGICAGCNSYLNKYNEEKSKLIIRNSEENAIHLQVYYDSYKGADIFNFVDHGEIGVTQKFLDVIKDFNCPDNVIIPSEWI